MSNRKFHASGWDESQVMATLCAAHDGDFAWNDPHNLKASYYAGDDVVKVARAAFDLYMSDNAVYGGSLYPSLPRLESEVIEMVMEMLNAPAEAAGMVTTGGTESIMLAVKAARDWARAEKPGIARANIIVPDSAHPAFVKAAHLLEMDVVRVAESAKHCADANAIRDQVDRNTIMVVGSAPPYPLGIVDPISDIAAVALEHDLWMHVDACIGGFMLPFAEDLGEVVPKFDFRIAGVTSMSADLHKYGYANRGSSTMIVRDKSLQLHQRFSNGDWPGGTYSTLGFAGSRASGPVASAWAVMRYLGFDGYRERVRGIIEAKHKFTEEIERSGELSVIGTPQGGNISVTCESVDMFAFADGMEKKGWRLGRLQRPAGLILLLNYRHGEVAKEFGADLSQVIDDVRAGRVTRSTGDAVYVT
jgi:sphinganine-1-phosphate aldolase